MCSYKRKQPLNTRAEVANPKSHAFTIKLHLQLSIMCNNEFTNRSWNHSP